jgi:arsenate reductase
MKKKVLFICTHNSCRSQMAEALLRRHFGGRFEVFSAGSEPTDVDPMVITALEEKGIDMSSYRSKPVEEFTGVEFDEVVTVCDNAKETCPFFPGAKKYTHQGFVDPPDLAEEGTGRMEAFRSVRDEIEKWILSHFSGS